MGAVAKSGEFPGWWSERNNKQAAKLLRVFDQSATKPLEHMGVPSFPHVGGDHPIPQGMFVGLLFAPSVWPVDSETELAGESEALGREEQFHEQQGNEVHRLSQQVFNDSWTAGEGAEAAQAAYRATAAARFEQADVAGFAKKLVARVSSDVERTKRWMLRENNTAHQEAEAFLRSGTGQSIAHIAVILSQHRTMIQTYSADLHANVANDTLLFTNQFPLSPNGGKEPKIKQTGNGLTSDQSPDEPAPGAPPPRPAAGVAGDHSPGGERSPRTPGGRMVPHSPDNELGPLPKSTPSPLASLGGGGLPGLPSGGGGGGGGVPGFPMSMLQGLGKFPGATGLPSTGGLSSSVSPPPALSSLGADFGRGLAAGASAAGAMPAAPPPSAPVAPLMASPVESAVAAAAPVAAPVAAPMSSAAPAAGVSGMAAGGLAPYGSVLSPAMSSAAPAGVGAPAGLSVPAEGAVSSAGGGSSAGLMPVGGRRGVTPVSRDRAESDLGLARMAVADLAGAASVTDPGLDWAVAVGRGRSGATCFWVATNDGATYIPPGVFVGKTWPIAAVFDEDFDARWFGWVNPADKAVRAARALGVAVSAVATSWALPSEYLTDDMAVPEIATGVKPSSVENLASELSRSRSHRLQTVDAALYQAVVAAKDSVVREYSRELLRRLVFGGADDLSAVAQSVAAALVAGRWPAREEWAALGAEYDTAVILAGAQRPGLDGLENPDQMVSYARLFVNCRRLEALLCWERYGGDLANVVYAAWVCGVRLSFSNIASSYVLT